MVFGGAWRRKGRQAIGLLNGTPEPPHLQELKMQRPRLNPTPVPLARSECFAEDLCSAPPGWLPPAATRRHWQGSAVLGAAVLAAVVLASPARADTIVSYIYAGMVDNDDAGRGWTSFTGQIAFERFAIDVIADPARPITRSATRPTAIGRTA